MGHLRIGFVRAGRRINGSRGAAGRTACGAAITARDVTTADARRAMRSGELDRWVECDQCRTAIRRMAERAHG